MATVKISALTELTTTATDDVIAIVDTSTSTTKKIQVGNLIDLPTAPAGIATDTNKEYNLKLTDVSGTETLTWVEETDDNTTYSTATTSTEGLVKLEDGTAQTVAANTATATASRTYGVQLNGTGQAVVNVPWVDTDTDTDTTYSTATASTSGLVKIEDDTEQTVAANTVSATAGKTYGVQLNSSDQAVVNVPWTDTDTNTNQLTTFTVSATTDTTATTISQGDDLMFTAGTGITCETTADGTVTISNTVTDTDTTYTTATASALGLIKIEDNTDQTVAANAVSATASRTYGVQLNASDQAVVNVPWTEGASTTKGFYEHPKEITTAVTITTDYNAVTVGPITYSGAGSITVPSGSTWVIL